MTDLAIVLTVLDIIGEEIEKQENHSCPVCTEVIERLRLMQVHEESRLVDQTREEYGIV